MIAVSAGFLSLSIFSNVHMFATKFTGPFAMDKSSAAFAIVLVLMIRELWALSEALWWLFDSDSLFGICDELQLIDGEAADPFSNYSLGRISRKECFTN